MPELLLYSPTAVHDFAETHATAANKVDFEPLGAGVGSIAHFVPSHNSASEFGVSLPTAEHVVADVHETPANELFSAPIGVDVGSITHFLPVQDSATVRLVPLLLLYCPTTLHVVGGMQATPASRL